MSKKKFSLKSIMPLLKSTFKGFSEDKVPKLSASLAYYTVFSLGPLLVVIITLCAFILGADAVNDTIYSQMKGFVGASAADQMQEIVKNASLSGKSTTAAIIGGVTLLIGATSIFGEIQDSINGIWGLKPKPKAGIWKMIKNRLLSFGILGTLGFLLLVSLGATSLVEAIGDRLKDRFPDVTVVVFYIINLVLTLAITTFLFAVIFKVLPDAKIKWKDVWIGAIFTSFMFLIGKFAISLYISKADVGGTYGTAGSLVVILVWIYYSSMILYLGAEFTKSYVMSYGDAIHPNHYAVTVQKVEVEKGNKSIQQVEKEAPKDEAAVAGKAPGKPEPVYQPIKPELAYIKSTTPEKVTHISGIPAIIVGIVAFVAHFVKSNRTQA
ncbi:MAG: YihY/virulence factor BrkB family protein [Flaviaesturariibacter sp.]|nr:YihY/virulence factor BrkB family protein [Flaviaesturariibacter sp.]